MLVSHCDTVFNKLESYIQMYEYKIMDSKL